MKIVVQNPHLTSDTWASGINDYVVEFLRIFRPAIRITPPHRYIKWIRFLRKKRLPLTGWNYVLSTSELNRYDVWISFNGTSMILHDEIPAHFSGLKLYHVMDYSFWTNEAAAAFHDAKVDYLLGYARHDQWCDFFKSAFPKYRNRVVPVPFGFAPRFENNIPFSQRIRKCAALGSVNPVRDPMSDPQSISAYTSFFSNMEWAHPMRQAIRENLGALEDIIENYLPILPATKNLGYDSVEVLNRHQLFVNDDSIMHYPPARTFEGPACGCVMVCSDHPCFEDYGWQDDCNCVRHRFADMKDFERVVRKALRDQGRLVEIHANSVTHIQAFSHKAIANGLHEMIQALWRSNSNTIEGFWFNRNRSQDAS